MSCLDNMANQIGTNVHHFRKLRQLAIVDLADASGLTFEKIKAIENFEETIVTQKELSSLAYALQVKKEYLIGNHRTKDGFIEQDQALKAYPGAVNPMIHGHGPIIA